MEVKMVWVVIDQVLLLTLPFLDTLVESVWFGKMDNVGDYLHEDNVPSSRKPIFSH
jgi:hypothetical protein